jgi:hypothetical protein
VHSQGSDGITGVQFLLHAWLELVLVPAGVCRDRQNKSDVSKADVVKQVQQANCFQHLSYCCLSSVQSQCSNKSLALAVFRSRSLSQSQSFAEQSSCCSSSFVGPHYSSAVLSQSQSFAVVVIRSRSHLQFSHGVAAALSLDHPLLVPVFRNRSHSVPMCLWQLWGSSQLNALCLWSILIDPCLRCLKLPWYVCDHAVCCHVVCWFPGASLIFSVADIGAAPPFGLGLSGQLGSGFLGLGLSGSLGSGRGTVCEGGVLGSGRGTACEGGVLGSSRGTGCEG